MDGYDAAKYEYLKDKIESNGLKIEIRGDDFELTRDGQMIGLLRTVDAAFHFVCGYEWGVAHGEAKR